MSGVTITTTVDPASLDSKQLEPFVREANGRGLVKPVMCMVDTLGQDEVAYRDALLKDFANKGVKENTDFNNASKAYFDNNFVPDDGANGRREKSLIRLASGLITATDIAAARAIDPIGINLDLVVYDNTPRSHQDLIDAWQVVAKKYGVQLSQWNQRLEFLQQWDPNVLSGFDPNGADVRFALVYRGYNAANEGTVKEQHVALGNLRSNHLGSLINPLFLDEGAQRAFNLSGASDLFYASYVRLITADPAKDTLFGGDVPRAFAFVDVRGGVGVDVDGSDVDDGLAAPLQVGLPF
jgi:hypothetical protein